MESARAYALLSGVRCVALDSEGFGKHPFALVQLATFTTVIVELQMHKGVCGFEFIPSSGLRFLMTCNTKKVCWGNDLGKLAKTMGEEVHNCHDMQLSKQQLGMQGGANDLARLTEGLTYYLNRLNVRKEVSKDDLTHEFINNSKNPNPQNFLKLGFLEYMQRWMRGALQQWRQWR